MIESSRGDILRAPVDALVNPVNCVGVMGRGLALQFRKEFPENFKFYEAACQRQEVVPGTMLVFATRRFSPPRYIVNFPTKRHWKDQSRIEDIEIGLSALATEIEEAGILSIAIPPLGCGLGGLNWSEVRPKIVQAFASLPRVPVWLFEPTEAQALEKEQHAPNACPSHG